MDQVTDRPRTPIPPKTVHAPCFFNSQGVDKEMCASLTKVARRNREGCCGNGRFRPCTSPWRLCVACVSHGGTPQPIVDVQTGLCKFHTEHGADGGQWGPAKRPQPAPVQQAVATSRAIGGSHQPATFGANRPIDGDVLPPEDHVSEKKGREILERIRLAMSKGTLITVPPQQIRPMAGQPRTYFNPERMQSLADSIESSGQWTPGIIRHVPPDAEGHIYELLDGERRLRAVEMRKGPGYRAIWVEIDEEAAPFVVSVITNFNRETHTTLELVDSVIKMHEKLGMGMRAIGKAIGIGAQTVSNLYRLRKLDQRVRDQMDPAVTKGRLLPTSAALKISVLPPEQQVEIANRYMSGEVGLLTLREEVVRVADAAHVAIPQRRVTQDDQRKSVDRKVGVLTKAAEDLRSLLQSQDVYRAVMHYPAGRITGLQQSVIAAKADVLTCLQVFERLAKEKAESLKP